MKSAAPQTLNELFDDLQVVEEDVRKVIIENYQASSKIYYASLVLWGAANRTISQCRGFASMVRDKNFTCSSAILRMQLDTVLRLYGGLRFGHIDEYADKIMDGQRVSDLKSHDGKRLFDTMLVKELSKQLPWISTVYDQSSGSIHLSRRHVLLAMGELNPDGSVEMQIGPSDRYVGDDLFLEVGQAFLHTTYLAIQMISEWNSRIPPERA